MFWGFYRFFYSRSGISEKLEKLKEKFQKEEFTEKLDNLAKQVLATYFLQRWLCSVHVRHARTQRRFS